MINSVIDTLKYNHDISVREHLGFDSAATQQLKFHTYKSGNKGIGELKFDNNLQGRGIRIFSTGTIHMGYWNDGVPAPGNYLYIYSGGNVEVGQIYLKEGKRWIKGTQYNSNGTT